jgi:hypothetical protein
MTAISQNLFFFPVIFRKLMSLLFLIFVVYLAAAGGLLGLGFGFSILSAAELFYFFLVRWFYYWYQSKRQDQMIIKVRPSYPLINTRQQMQRKSNRVFASILTSNLLLLIID